MKVEDIDAEGLRLMLSIGGLDVPVERAAKILPVARSLLQSCERLLALDIGAPAGAGIATAPRERK